ncbi:aldehyde ferredoxin oxidoreductase family protein [Chloroflexota bacterium]
MASGYTATILRVNLTLEQTAKEYVSEEILKLHIGGVGLGAKILYDEVSPGVEWNDPENRLIFASGPMNGTKVAGSGTFCVVTRGPLTNGAASSQANGYFGAYLKFSGFDGIVIEGRATRWLYLYIANETAELRDATHLCGKDTWETEELIKADLGKGELEASVFGIGPAGENQVKFAAIVGDKGHVAGHNGVGAVMGAKKLKAVAVARGRASVAIKDRPRLLNTARKTLNEFKGTPSYNWGTSQIYSSQLQRGTLPVRNLTTNLFPEYAKFMGQYYRSQFELVKRHPCWACPAHHCHIYKITDGPYSGYIGEEPDYESWAAWSSLIGQTDLGSAFMLSNLTDRLGMEVNEAGWLLALVMECYEKGLISEKETDGLQMNWGNTEAVAAMLHKIANRQGFGDILAEGVMRAAERLGGEALNIAVYLKKGNAPRGHDHRARWAEMIDVASSNTGTIETGPVPLSDPFSPDEISSTVAKAKGVSNFVDCLVMCMFATMTYSSKYVDHLVDMLNAVTGWDITVEEAGKAGFRVVNLLRAFNIRHGIKPDVEAPSVRYSSTPVDGPAKGLSIAPYWEQMLDNYYKEMGWERTSGKPLPETLRRLGLDYVISDISGEDDVTDSSRGQS